MRISILTCLLAGAVSFGLASAGDYNQLSSVSPVGKHSYHSSTTLDLGIHGYIKPHCALHLDVKDIRETLTDDSGSTHVGFDVNCNQRLSVEIKSQNGALLHENWQRLISSPGFTDRVPYELEFSVGVDGAQPIQVNSRDIANMPRGGSTGVVPYQARGKRQLNWSPELPLIGGNYGDVIEIRVTGEGGMGGHS